MLNAIVADLGTSHPRSKLSNNYSKSLGIFNTFNTRTIHERRSGGRSLTCP